MKRYLFVAILFTSALLSACRGDDQDVDPNKTLVYVGNWKGEQIKENGYDTRTDWAVTRENNNAIKVVSTFNFITTSDKYQSYSEKIVLPYVDVADDKTLIIKEKYAEGGDTLDVTSVGVVEGDMLTVTSDGKYRKTGQAMKTIVQKFTRQ